MKRKTLGTQKHPSVLNLSAIVLLAVSINSSFAIQVGKFAYKGALEEFNNDTITVSDTMIALSNKIYAKTDFSVGADTIVDTPSIMFLIDNSSSMDNTAKDRNGNRFTVTKAFIDSIRAKYPTAEIGLAVFGSTLWFDPGDHPYSINFSTCSAQDSGGYIPLLKLDSVYASMNNQTGLTILKNILSDTVISRVTRLKYTPSNRNLGGRNTNINNGFDAVRCAMNEARRPKGNHYVIFLSDGEANVPPPMGSAAANTFTGAVNIPTTFTVYFTNDNTVPPTIQTFTTNVRANGYSTRNDSSNAWAYDNQSAEQLLSFLMDNIFSVIKTSTPGNPAQISIGTQTSTSWSVVDSSFVFPNIFPLTGWVTPFSAKIKYRFPNGDTSHIINFYVKRQPNFLVTPPALYEQKYWDRNLNLRNKNAAVTMITETMDSLELLVDYNPGTAIFNYSNIKVQVHNQLGTAQDNELFTLTKGTNSFSVKFKRVVSPMPIPGNKIFEHMGIAGDSLVAVFRNSEGPTLPLDTLRIAIPFNITPIPSLTSAFTRDLNGNGLIDHIELVFSDTVKLDSTMLAGFSVRGTAGAFHPSGISRINSSTYLLSLTEIKTSLPQTAWAPGVTITNIPNVQPELNFRTTDGCPPVVWEVKKYIIDSDRTHDTVKIFLSEKITTATGLPVTFQTPPSDVFHVWVADGASFTLADTMFAGIPGLTRVINDSILVFTMTNGRDLGIGNYINIRDNKRIRDKAGNFPSTENQKVRVTIVVGDIFKIITGPNPARPALNRPEALKFEHNINAVNWVRQGQGTVISLRDLSIPVDPEDVRKVKAYLKIIDIVGNTVNWCQTEENGLFATVPTSGSTPPSMNLYWNGLNHEGMAVAPGTYRVVVYINYPRGSNISDVRVISKIGIKR